MSLVLSTFNAKIDGSSTDTVSGSEPRPDNPSMGSGGALSGTGGAGGNLGSGGTGDASNCVQCSADLHHVTDCKGNIIMTCPSNLACATGRCVEPCQAAWANGSTQGCEFYSVLPAPEPDSRGSCFAALVSNTWTSPVTLTVEYAGMPLDVAKIARIPTGSGIDLKYQPLPGGQLAPGQMAVLFLSGIEADPTYEQRFRRRCPSPSGVQADVAINDTGPKARCCSSCKRSGWPAA